MLKYIKRLPIVSTLVTLCAVVIMFGLANWQLQRGLDKTQRIESMATASARESLSLEQVRTYKGDIQDLPITINATLNPEQILLLDNRIHQGRPGFEVYAVAKSDGHNVLVNFGWITGKQMRSDLPTVTLPDLLAGERGRVVLPSNNPLITETASLAVTWPKVIQQIDIHFVEQMLQIELVPFVIVLTVNDNPQFVRKWQPVVMPPEKHYAYAVQWLGLGVAAFLVYFFALRNRLNKVSNDEHQ
ncbi:SURF1 family protein [Paraglaciecola sp. 20A4]|uniref:SURF1 family protein n=1 Tax=Paraglaciecola sp. 20A4 TaxID=2687288 RepID=UPI001F115236|nr:SURF1 family protein [Paraglaciecola sp. 20A4]